MNELKDICRLVADAAKETEKFILKESERFSTAHLETKGVHDFVSYVDRGSEEMLVPMLEKILPGAGFITEEGTISKKGSGYCWVIDPLDGTTNFIHGLKPYAISIGLLEKDEPVAGIVCNAGMNEMFTAWKNGGAWLNGNRIRVSETLKLSGSLIATGFPYNDFSLIERYMKCLTWFCKNSHGIRRPGSASIDLSYVACGRFDAFYEYDLKLWDVAAGIILVREAGGRVSDFSANENNISGREIIASNSMVFSEFLEIVSKFMVE